MDKKASSLDSLLEQNWSAKLEQNEQILQQVFDRCGDVVYRRLLVKNQRAILIFISGYVDTNLVEEKVIHPLQQIEPDGSGWIGLERMAEKLTYSSSPSIIEGVREGVEAVLSGNTLLLVDKIKGALLINSRSFEQRAVQESVSETSVRGPKDAFVENIETNFVMLRRRIQTPNFKMEKTQVGKLTKTEVRIAYIDGLVDPDLVAEVKRRIDKIEIDSVLDSQYIAELIRDARYSLFPMINHTERPDKIAANILEGRVAILVDNSPAVLTVPTLFFEFLQVPGDYYENYYLSSSIRLLRLVAFNIAFILPSLYVAIVTIHHQVLQRPLLLNIAASREGVPFPTVVEAMFMEVMFEVLREAGLRLPRVIGQAVSIAGALVIGEAAVAAGLVLPSTVIIVAVTAIATFTIPNYELGGTIRILRFPMLILSSIFGLLGLALGLIVIQIHLNSLRSFGVPFMSPINPYYPSELKDVLIRAPWWKMIIRPRLGRTPDQRQDTGPPKPEQKRWN